MSASVSYEQALSLLPRISAGSETIPIAQAAGRRLTGDIIAGIDRPSDTVSAMDGYAVRLRDVGEAGTQLTVIGEAPAGHPYTGEVRSGQALRIFTGGVVPKGADHIVIQEDVARAGDQITTRRAYTGEEFVRAAGMDFHKGKVLLGKGHILEPASIGLASAANVADVTVVKRPRIAILTSGDELKPAGSVLGVGDVVNSNLYALSAAITAWGGEAVNLGIACDDISDIQSRIASGEDIDLFLPVGGASVGDHDLMRPAFADLGFVSVFDRVAVRPGKPTWCSTRDQTCVLGLPGNPASALVCARLFLKPMLTDKPNRMFPVVSDSPISANGPRAHFMRANVSVGPGGALSAKPASNQDSSLIGPMVECNALLYRQANAEAIEPGQTAFVIMTGDL
ncbi:MAG: molybdopterin molybdotransferase MoeA [Pseudomonadota bacterium]